MTRRIRIPGRFAAAAGLLLVLAAAPTPALSAGFVNSGVMTVKIQTHEV